MNEQRELDRRIREVEKVQTELAMRIYELGVVFRDQILPRIKKLEQAMLSPASKGDSNDE